MTPPANLRDTTMKTTPKTWGYVQCFDSGHYPNQWIEGTSNRDTLLPNVPMRAKNTLLAALLRTGRFATGAKLKPAAPAPGLVDRAKERNIGKLLGVEIEYYPDSRIASSPLKNVCGDGSLNAGGQEVRKLTWASRSGRLDGLLALKLSGRVDKACGLHVHVDARHLGKNGLLSAEQTYDRVTECYAFLKKLVPKSRLSNRYCAWRNNREGAETFRRPANGLRYAAVNWQSFCEHGTIEFRCQGGSLNVIKIETWALLCQWIVNYLAKPENTVPRSWAQFVALLPEPLRSWSILRKEKLYGNCPLMDERTLSAIN